MRDARREDAAGVAVLLTELGYPATATEAGEYVARFQASPRSRVLVAEASDEVVGLVATHLVPRLDADAWSCRITDIVVRGDHRRRGVASKLLEAAENEARRHAATRLDLSSADERHDAHGFYGRSGFTTRAGAFTKRL